MFYHSYGVFSQCTINLFHVLTYVCCPSSFHCITLRRFWLNLSIICRELQRAAPPHLFFYRLNKPIWFSQALLVPYKLPAGSLLDSFQHINVNLILRSPKLGTVLQQQCLKCSTQGKNYFPQLAGSTLFLYSAWYGIHHWVTSSYEWNAQLASYADFETLLFCQEAMKPEERPSSVSILVSSLLLANLSITLCLVELFMFSSSIMLLSDKSLLDAGCKCVCQWQHTDLWVLKNQ